MARQRVVVQCTTADERERVTSALEDATVAGVVVSGQIDEQRIPELRAAGLSVDVFHEQVDAALAGGGSAPASTVRTSLGDAVAADALELMAAPVQSDDMWVLQVAGPLLPQWREQLEQHDVTVIEHQGGFRYTARLRLGQVGEVDELPFIAGLRPYATTDTIHPTQLTTAAFAAETAEPAPLELLVHRPEDMDRVLAWVEEQGATVHLHTDRKVRLQALDRAFAQRLAALPEVATLYAYERPEPANDHARMLLGVDGARSPVAPVLTQTGRGQLVGVADTGLDDAHPDFRGRIAALIPRGIPGVTSDPHGHGTHVTGSVVGDGAASGGAIRGTAPEAKVVFQALLDRSGALGGLDPSVGDLLQQAYDAGVRIHNNSWGVRRNASAYRADSLELDEFVAAHPDMLVVMAAGNSATAFQSANSEPGFVDLMSLDAPATAKNALTVGACRSDRPLPSPGATFGRSWPEDFPDPPVRDAQVSGDPESMAAFSGRGPCDEQLRMKPDVVAPGTLILSTRASTARARFWAPYPPNGHYVFEGGTSMAAPLVTGCAVLVRQYLVEERRHAPSAALLKAMIVNGTRWLSGQDAVANHAKSPNYHQGFGCVSLGTTIPNASAPAFAVDFCDAWSTDEFDLLGTGDGWGFTFKADGELPLRVCLAWTDPPGRSVQNSLRLNVSHPDSGKVWKGNADRPTMIRSDTDMANNVQVVRLDAPAAGDYVVTVVGWSVTHAPQRFALAVGGALKSRLVSIGRLGRL
jgi:subtilisin family serine protease